MASQVPGRTKNADHTINTYILFLLIEVAQGPHNGNKETGSVWLNNHVLNVIDFVAILAQTSSCRLDRL